MNVEVQPLPAGTEAALMHVTTATLTTVLLKKGLRNVWKSNGYINEGPLRRLCRDMDAANIDLKGYDDKTYEALSKADADMYDEKRRYYAELNKQR